MSYTASAHPVLRVRSGRRGFRQRMRSGQTLVIFALSFTVLLGMAGLVIDVGRAYDLYARMQRAAEAGALAGVLYMPNYYNTMRPGDIDSAVSRASKEVVEDGYGTALPYNASACVAGAPVSICPVSANQYDLQVTITQTLDLVLLSGLGVQPVTLIATAQADYLPPAQLGARTNYFGDKVECNNSGSIQACDPNDGTYPHLQSFLASFIGPDDLKEYGDPYVYCEEGPAYTGTPDGSASSPPFTYNGVGTNHPQYLDGITDHCGEPTDVTAGNPDQQPVGYSGPKTQPTAHPGGYNYLVTVPSGVGNADIWVYNPSFIPCDSSCGYANFDHFIGSNPQYYMGPSGNGIKTFDGKYDAPPFYYDITYSLYQVNSLYDRSSDTPLGSVTYPSYDAMSGDLSIHGCTAGEIYDPYWNGGATNNYYNQPYPTTPGSNGCFPSATGNPTPYDTTAEAPCWQQWCTLYPNLPAGTYRLVIEATGLMSATSSYISDTTSGYGEHEYALKVCPAGLSSPIGCSAGSNPGCRSRRGTIWMCTSHPH